MPLRRTARAAAAVLLHAVIACGMQRFAFVDGDRRSLAVLNLSRLETLPISFAGGIASRGLVEQTTLTSAPIEDSNEQGANMLPVTDVVKNFDPAPPDGLPPFSLTTHSWKMLRR